ncbi:tetratricopeptide repeat protein [Calycomorphotria hydatis]|uniref:Ancillary SecYEG translocon subunit/Cell division coordinator CpoB TPR domain-containing protein n=1 Tax=Calycomorphotria hydatis TaxID=2528027 RepID=A0A517TBU4_9PLAN|nr:tetratricopeptide repeat protein [Calycomorphotria hydatis]QDT65847.1 hypothetical protein V22_31090 [Calycomorphotria hydatis]
MLPINACLPRISWLGIYALPVLITLLGSHIALALDEVFLVGEDKSVRGRITDVSATELTLEAGAITKTVPAHTVHAVKWDDAPAKLNLTRAREENGDLADALTDYQEILSAIPRSNKFITADVEFLIARTMAKQALADSSKQKAAMDALEKYRAEHTNFFRHNEGLFWLGRVYDAANEDLKSQSVFDELSRSPVPEYQSSAKIALARLALKEGKLAEANRAFAEVAKLPADTPALKERQFEALLGQAAVLQAEKKHEQALKVLQDIVNRSQPSDKVIQAEAFLRQGDNLQALGRTKEALLAYLHVDVIFSMEAGPHAESLYQLIKLWNAVGKPERSADARARLMDQYPNSQWAGML